MQHAHPEGFVALPHHPSASPLPPVPAGKTSLLQVLAGKYMVGQETVRILGRPAFHDLQLVSGPAAGGWCLGAWVLG
jgi:hypothetical protein